MRLELLEISPDIAMAYGLEKEAILEEADAYDRLAEAAEAARKAKANEAYLAANQYERQYKRIFDAGLRWEPEGQQSKEMWWRNERLSHMEEGSDEYNDEIRALE